MKVMQKIGFPIALLLLIIAWFVPIAGIDELTRKTLGLMFFTITLWITRPVPPALSAMLFMVFAWALNLVPFDVSFSGFANETTWFIWGALLLALAVKETSLGLRIARMLATKTPASTKGMLASYHVLSYLITYLIPSSTAKVAALAPIAAAQMETLGVPLKSRAGKMLMTSLVTVNSYIGSLLLSGGSAVVTSWGVLLGLGIEISWLQWWLYMIVPGLLAMTVHFFVCLLIFRPEPAKITDGASVKEVAKVELAKLGPMTLNEKKVSVIVALTVFLWATEPFHGLEAAMICCFCGIALCLPGIGVLKAKDALQKLNWSTIIFVASALSVATVTESTGVAEIIKQILASILTVGGNEFMFLLMMMPLGFLGRLAFRSGAANSAMLLGPAIILAQSLGYNPIYVALFFAMSLVAIFMYQNTPSLITYEYGTFEEPDFIVNGLARYAGSVAFITFAYFIWWPLVGA